MHPEQHYERNCAGSRQFLVALAATITTGLLLSGCTRGSTAAAPHPLLHNPNAVSDVRTILTAIEQDPCSSGSTDDYSDCQGRYIAQVSQVAKTALGAATHFPDPVDVRTTSQELITTSATFQKLTCGTTPDRRCRLALRAVDVKLRNLADATAANALPAS